MNDKQKDIALEMAVVRARMSMEHLAVNDYTPLKKELTELLAAFDAAADAIYAVLVATGNVPEVGE